MQSNALQKRVDITHVAPRAKVGGDNARRIMAKARYEAPSVASYPIAGCGQSNSLSMIGNLSPMSMIGNT